MSLLFKERDRVAEIDSEIFRLQAEREPLKELLETYIYPVLTLPNEIVSECFIHVLPPYPARPPTTGPLSPTSLAQICRKWREIALSTPALWSSLTLTLEYGKSEKQKSFLETWMARSRAHPISVSLIDEREELELGALNPFFDTVCRVHSTHIQHLELRLLRLGDSNIALIQSTPMPLLSSLKIWVHHVDTKDPVKIFQNAPRLRTLELRHFHAKLVLPWSQLTTFICHRIDFLDWASILREAATSLMHCEISELGTEQLNDHRLGVAPLPPLSALRSLIFKPECYRAHGLTKGLLSALTLPVLRRLHIPEEYIGRQPIHKLLGFIERSGCGATLKELHVIDPGLQQKMYLKMFGESIEEITVEFQEETVEFHEETPVVRRGGGGGGNGIATTVWSDGDASGSGSEEQEEDEDDDGLDWHEDEDDDDDENNPCGWGGEEEEDGENMDNDGQSEEDGDNDGQSGDDEY
ncbi:hypothetical protein C8F04DRAFT_325418 [Mycena alexandri]|uniref:F-box domain-containing protein n=1 Tax=Mycena alexandri TaxID=1745969 RepID=A0AAD6WNZ6_9AGAR|nr:hypothetical protein C8F04DRAFT_325418 [Mycena alexandri]